MEMYWTLCGETADKYPSHRYRVPICNRIEFGEVLEPRRLNLAEPYPNWGGPPIPRTLRTESRVNVSAHVAATDKATSTRKVTAYLEPSRYSLCKERKPVFEMTIGGSLLWDTNGLDRAILGEFCKGRS